MAQDYYIIDTTSTTTASGTLTNYVYGSTTVSSIEQTQSNLAFGFLFFMLISGFIITYFARRWNK